MDHDPAHILVVDDDPDIRDLVARYLRDHGLTVTTAAGGRDMDAVLAAGPVDLVVLDILMPGEDGLSLCRRLRAGTPLPVIMLTAVAEDTDRIVGLEMGADDYLTKPFNPRELLARIRAVLRRTASPAATPVHDPGRPAVLAFAGWRLDPGQRRLHGPDGRHVRLTPGEFDVLLAFAEHPQRVLTRDQLLDLARGRMAEAFDRSIDIQVSRLRRKMEPDPREPQLIVTVRNEGYLFAPAVHRET